MKADPTLPFIPVILVTARADAKDVVAGLEAGGDDYLTKPVDQAALMARVRAMLRIKALHDTVQEQAHRLEDQAAELARGTATWKRGSRPSSARLERMGTLKRFLAPQLAELIVVAGRRAASSKTHRRDIVVVFCDLRGFTAFAETAEPEEVLDLMREYHAALGPIVYALRGHARAISPATASWCCSTTRCPAPTPRRARGQDGASRCARRSRALQAGWRRRGREIGFGIGIAQGYATLGQIGFAERVDYTAIGTVCNLAARLCAEAKDGQILVSKRVAAAVDGTATLEEIGDLALKGLSQAVAVYNVAMA